MINIDEMIAGADAETVAGWAVACIRRIGQLGHEAGEAFQKASEAEGGDLYFEEGFNQINA